MMPMKQKLSILFAMLLLPGLFIGCTGHDALSDTGNMTSVQLCARGGVLEGVATRTEPKEAFTASVAFSLATGEYSSLTRKYEGIWKADVDASGKITWKTGDGVDAPVYPSYGEYLYLVAYAPEAISSSGTVTYDLTEQPDLLYVSELRDSKWDGDRFSENTLSEKDKPLAFNHLLTRLCFKACKKQAGTPKVSIIGIRVNGTDTRAALALATGETVFSTPSGGGKALSFTPANGGIDITGTAAVTVGSLMLPPPYEQSGYLHPDSPDLGRYL